MGVVVENYENGSTVGKLTLSPEQIAKGVAAFQKVSLCLQKNKTPLFSDEAATIYLQFSTGTSYGSDFEGYAGKIQLAHPLSYNRSVCLYLATEKEGNLESELIAKLKEIGVEGDIKVMSLSEMETLIKDTDTLEEHCKAYDMHVIGMRLKTKVATALRCVINASRQQFGHSRLDRTLTKQFESHFSDSTMSKDPSAGYVVKVGHTGMTAEQIAENVKAVLDKLLIEDGGFPRGLAHFKTVTLKTGLTDGVAIFTNDGEVVAEPLKEMKMLKTKVTEAAASVPITSRKRNAADRNAAAVNGQQVAVEETDAPAGKKKKPSDNAAAESEEEVASVNAIESPARKKKNKKRRKKSSNGIAPVVKGEAVSVKEIESLDVVMEDNEVAAGSEESAVHATKSPAGKKKKNKKKPSNSIDPGVTGGAVSVKEIDSPVVKKKNKEVAAGSEPSGVQLSAFGEKMKKRKMFGSKRLQKRV